MPEILEETVPVVASKTKVRESPARIALYLLAGAVSVYLATWAGAATFYIQFQRPLLAREGGPLHTVLWHEPQAGQSAASEADDQAWASQIVEGNRVPLPPGRLVSAKNDGGAIRLRLEEGEVTISCYPAGFFVSLLREMSSNVGLKPGGASSDACVLEEVARETLGRYRFGWRESERQPYAARLLSKMSLWDLKPVKRFELARRDGACAVLVEYESGEARVVASSPGGALAAVIPADAPAAWKETPANWLDFGPTGAGSKPVAAAAAPSRETTEAR
jgi:hypothetical protein